MLALTIREQAVGPYHPDVAQSLQGLAILYGAQGKYEQAVPLGERSLAIREQVLGPIHPDVAQSLNNLGELYRNRGDYEQAIALTQRAIAIREQVLGKTHPEVAHSLNNLGDHSRSGANSLLVMKVPPCFLSAFNADMLCVEITSKEEGHKQHRPNSAGLPTPYLDTRNQSTNLASPSRPQ